MNVKALRLMIACGLVGTTASIAASELPEPIFSLEEVEAMGAGADAARPFTINITGATLMENFIRSVASTNDFIDVDGDGRIVPAIIDNLAPTLPSFPYNAAQWWNVQYRVVGSVNGYQELLDYGVGCAVNGDIGSPVAGTTIQNAPPASLSSDVCQLAYINGVNQYIVNGQPGGNASAQFTANNPGGVPTVTWCGTTMPPVNKTIYSSLDRPENVVAGGPGGFRADIAPLDVPTSWANTVPGTPTFDDIPFEEGYGLNPRLNVNRDGTTFVDPNGNNFGFRLVTVNPPFNSFNPPAVPNAFTVFDTDFAYTPVAAITNHGTGYQTVTYTTQRHMLTTGRTETGENLVQVTRDTGSGTHNAYVNSFCIDPSHGVGEAVGGLSSSSQEQLAGPFFIPGNKAGSGGVEATARNNRLAFTYSGAERGVNSGWLTGGRLEVLGVLNDLDGGTVAARPTIANVLGFQTIDFTSPFNHIPLANRFNGFNIGGPGVLATLGDPRSSLNDDRFGNNVAGVDAGNTNPALRNPQAAAYINNITRSTESFIALGPDPNAFSPGEFLAQTLIINGSRAFTQNRANPCNLIAANESGGVPIVDSLVAQVASVNTLNNAAYVTFGSVSLNGRTPSRFVLAAGGRYSDGLGTASPNNVFRRQGGTTVGYDNTDLRNRNRIAGDFNGDFQRNWNDAPEMMEAYLDRQNRTDDGLTSTTPWDGGGVATTAGPGADAIIEVLGDFNSDGNFGRRWTGSAFVADTADIRYWADGLALDPVTRRLNRCEGFKRVDQAWLALVPGDNNFFNTTLATPKAYAAGDSTGDVAGPSGLQTPNFQPVGHDGVVNAFDIDYVYAQFLRNPRVTDGALNWANLSEAQFGINSRGEVVGNLSADIDGNLVIDQADIVKLVTVILGTDLCDVNLDGVKNSADEAIIVANLGNNTSGWATGDVNGDGVTNQADLDQCFPQVPVCCRGNASKNTDGGPGADVNFADVTAVLGAFGQAGNPNGTTVGDADCSGAINFADITDVLSNFGNNCD